MKIDMKIPNRWTVEDREQNLAHDSYFYATIFDADTGEEWTGMIGTTAAGGGHYHSPYPNIDTAPDEVRAAYWEIRAAKVREAGLKDIREQAEYFADGDVFIGDERYAAPKGTLVEVFKGRKVPKGTTGTVAWVGPDKFNPGMVRYGLDVDGERVWVAGGNVRLVETETFKVDDHRIEMFVERWVTAPAATKDCRCKVRVPVPGKAEMVDEGILIPA